MLIAFTGIHGRLPVINTERHPVPTAVVQNKAALASRDLSAFFHDSVLHVGFTNPVHLNFLSGAFHICLKRMMNAFSQLESSAQDEIISI